MDLLVERTVFIGTNGTNPKAGVDLEPDYPEQNFQNVTFKDCISRDNVGAGFTVALINLNRSSAAVSIALNRTSPSTAGIRRGWTSEGSDLALKAL